MSAFDKVIGRAWEKNILFSVLLELTYRCNLDCFFCYNDLSLAGRALTKAQYLALLDDLAAMNVFSVTLSGGEPLAHPDFFDLGRAARERGFAVKVKSNGHALSGVLAKRLHDEVDPWLVETSLHGAVAATHDRQTRVPGSFDRLVANVRGLVAMGVKVKINSTLTRWNEDEIADMFDLADSLGCALSVDSVVTPRDDGDRSPQEIMASPAGMRRLAELQQRRSPPVPLAVGAVPAPAREKNCGAGSSILAIDPYGNVYPCVNWRRPSGNLHEASIREIWQGSGALREIRELTKDVAIAAREAMPGKVEAHSFCPGTAESLLGSPTAIYPQWKQMRELESDIVRSNREA